MQTTEISLAAFALGLAANMAERITERAFVARTLRPDREYRLADRRAVHVLDWNYHGTGQLQVQVWGERSTSLRHPNGRVDRDQPGEMDVFEANPPVTRWLRIYDRKLNDAGKQVVGGKEFAAERGLFIYMFDTEAEARSSLQGVRALVPLTYYEGEGLG